MDILLSIIIPVYNSEKYLEKCLNSLLLKEKYKYLYEIIIVNDGSLDDSSSILASYSYKYDFIHVFDQSNKGQASARNLGLKQAKGKYVFFVDSDDFVITNSLEILLDWIIDKDLDILLFCHFAGNIKYLEQKIKEYRIDKIEVNPIITGEQYLSLFDYTNCPWLSFFNRKFLIESSLFFQEGYYLEDGIFMMESLLRAKRVSFVDLHVYLYVYRRGSTLRTYTKEHLRKLNESFLHAIDYMDGLIKSGLSVNKNTLCRCMAHRDSFIISLLFRFLRYSEDSYFVNEVMLFLIKKDLYPIHVTEYLPLKVKLLYRVVNNKKIFDMLFSIRQLFKC